MNDRYDYWAEFGGINWDGEYDSDYWDSIISNDELQTRPDESRVCAQCKHFYAAIEMHDTTDACNPKLFANEMRLCYEFHWRHAASTICDEEFEPLTDVKITNEIANEITAYLNNPTTMGLLWVIEQLVKKQGLGDEL